MLAANSFSTLCKRKFNAKNYKSNKDANSSILTKSPGLVIPSWDTKFLAQEEHHSQEEKPLMIQLNGSKSTIVNSNEEDINKLLTIESNGGKLEVVNFDEKDVDNDGSVEPITHTIHTQHIYFNPQTMKIEGFLKHQPTTILIDIDNVSNFLDNKVVGMLA